MKIHPHRIRLAAATSLLAMLFFAGCASVPKIEADKNTESQFKRIALLQIGEPQNVQIMNIGGPAAAFGLIGGLVQASDNSDHTKEFVERIKGLKPTLSETLTATLMETLKDDGFDVAVVSGQRPKRAADHKGLDYSGIHVEADAILMVNFGVTGYMSPPNSLSYLPWYTLRAELVDAKSKKTVYLKLFCVGYKMKIENAVQLPVDMKYRYKSFEAIMDHSDEAFKGLKDCGEIVAKQIGADLRP